MADLRWKFIRENLVEVIQYTERVHDGLSGAEDKFLRDMISKENEGQELSTSEYNSLATLSMEVRGLTTKRRSHSLEETEQ